MIDLSTNYLGLELKNPIIIGSSSLTSDLDNLINIEKAGAGAVVLKSIYEEQILAETEAMEKSSETDYHIEAWEYLERMGRDMGLQNYLNLIKQAKENLNIPVIPSINCISEGEWLHYAQKIENAGADALELNIYIVPTDKKLPAKDLEKRYFAILSKLKDKIEIPISLKISPYFSNILHFANQLTWRDVDGLVIFNRYYPFDIDLNKMELTSGKIYSSPEEKALSLRWISLMYDRIDCDLAATTGVHSADGVIKQILVGATAVQVVSVLYILGIDYIKSIVDNVMWWMDSNNYDSVDQFRGILSQKNSQYPYLYDRVQFIKAVVGIE